MSYETLFEHPIMLPPVPQQTYVDAFTEEDTSGKCLKEKEKQDQYEAECDLYRVLENLKSVARKIIVLHNFKFSKEQSKVVMTDSKNILGAGEHDFVVIVRNMGIVLFEVKAPVDITDSKFKRNATSSRKQLKRATELIDGICKTWNIDESVTKKVLQFTAFPRTSRQQVEEFLSYQKLPVDTANQIIFQDEMKSFGDWWANNVFSHLLEVTKNINLLESTLIGLWCINNKNSCNIDSCSMGHYIKQIDKAIKCAEITRNTTNPVSGNVKGSPLIFQDHFGVKCLTQEQKSIFKDSKRCQFIVGPAGSGKTLLLLGKIIELFKQSQTKRNCRTKRKFVLITGTKASTDDLKAIFTAAGMTSNFWFWHDIADSQTFAHCDVNLIYHERMDVDITVFHHKHFHRFEKNQEMILFKAMKDYMCNFFFDDLHEFLSSTLSKRDPSSNEEILINLKTIEQFIRVLIDSMNERLSYSSNVSYFWVAYDAFQLKGSTLKDFPVTLEGWLLIQKHTKSITDAIEKEITENEHLFRFVSKNLRNAAEINSMLENVRFNFYYSQLGISKLSDDHDLKKRVPTKSIGHLIHGPKPTLFVIMGGYSQDEVLSNVLRDELEKLLCVGNGLNPEDIAIIDGHVLTPSYAVYGPERIARKAMKRLPQFSGVKVISFAMDTQSSEWKAVIFVFEPITAFLNDYSHKRKKMSKMEWNKLLESRLVSWFAPLYIGLSRGRVYLSIIAVVPSYEQVADCYFKQALHMGTINDCCFAPGEFFERLTPIILRRQVNNESDDCLPAHRYVSALFQFFKESDVVYKIVYCEELYDVYVGRPRHRMCIDSITWKSLSNIIQLYESKLE